MGQYIGNLFIHSQDDLVLQREISSKYHAIVYTISQENNFRIFTVRDRNKCIVTITLSFKLELGLVFFIVSKSSQAVIMGYISRYFLILPRSLLFLPLVDVDKLRSIPLCLCIVSFLINTYPKKKKNRTSSSYTLTSHVK